jgi:uroporphyrinogen-III synthase
VIPRIVAPLTGLTVLVTRPLPQAHALADSIRSFGGEPIVFPSIAIEPCKTTTPESHDWIIFVSVPAVEHGAPRLGESSMARIAAIGKATAGALSAAGLPANVVADAPYTSEALLAHAAFNPAPGERVLIVRGGGGRETLRETLEARGAHVTTLDVYRRVKPKLSDGEVAALERRWADEGIDAVTATSVEALTNLAELLTPAGRELLIRTPLIAPTRRILEAARGLGWDAAGLITTGADDASIVGTLARWRARARDT